MGSPSCLAKQILLAFLVIRRILQLAEQLESSMSVAGVGVGMDAGLWWIRPLRLPVFVVGEVGGWRVSLRHRRRFLSFSSASMGVRHGYLFGCSLPFTAINRCM